MQERIFYSICFGFVFGVLLRSFIFINFYLVFWIVILAFFTVLFFSFISKNKWGIITSVFVLMFLFGILRFHITDKPLPEIFESQVGQKVSLSGFLVDEPDIRENNQKLTV
jgi:uncharacterized membrane protein YccC